MMILVLVLVAALVVVGVVVVFCEMKFEMRNRVKG
jgi:hypothetical protein